MADGIAITGPTASGKTDLAIAVAEQVGGEIISFDSRQVYIGMDIGTAKPTAQQRARVPHHGIDLVPPSLRYNAGIFSTDARAWIADIKQRGKIPVLVGGTGFFLRALTHPMFAEPPLDATRKEQLKQRFERFSREELLRWLEVLDADSAARMSREGGRQRLARAIEVALLTGKPLSQWHEEDSPEPALRFSTFVLELPRDVLFERINRRVEMMIEAGLVDEVKELMAKGYDEHSPGMNAVGYIELIPHIRREKPLDQAIDEIQRATRRYARRQTTWFRHQLPEGSVSVNAGRPLTEAISEISSNLRNL